MTVALVEGVDEAVRIEDMETSGLAAGIVADDAEAAERFLEGYRGTAAFWHAPTRFAGRIRADRRFGDGNQRRLGAGPALEAGHLPRSMDSPVPRRRRRDAAPMTVVVKLGTSCSRWPAWNDAAEHPAGADAGDRGGRRGRRTDCRRLVGGDRARSSASPGSIVARTRSTMLQAASALGQTRLQIAWERALGREECVPRRSCSRRRTSPTARLT